MRRFSRLGSFPWLACSLLVGMTGCDVPKTLTPDTEITTSLPLLEERVEIGERVAKADSVRINPANPNQFQLHFDQTEVDLGGNGRIGGDRMSVRDQDAQSVAARVGDIKLDDQPPASTPSVTLGELMPQLKSWPTDSIPFTVPQTQLPTSKEQINFQNIQQVTFTSSSSPDTNRILISFDNHLPLTIGPVDVYISTSGDTLPTGEVKDVVAQATIDSIQRDMSVAAPPLILAGVTLTSPSYVITRAQLKGGDAKVSALIPAYFSVTTDISALTVESAVAKIPRQTFARRQGISFASEKLQLLNVNLASVSHTDTNRFALNIKNELPTDVQVRYSLPELLIPSRPLVGASFLSEVRRANGGALDYGEASLDIGAKQTANILFDLAGTTLRNSQSPGSPVDSLRIGISTTIKGTGDAFVTINSSDSVRVDADMSALAIERVDGRVPPGDSIAVEIEPFTFDVEQQVPAGLEAFHAREITVKMLMTAFDAAVTANADMKLVVLAEGSGDPVASYRLVISKSVSSGTVVPFVITQDSIGQAGHSPLEVINATLDNIFDHGKSTMRVSGVITIRGNVSLVREKSRLEVTDLEVNSPLKFDVPAITFDGTEGDSAAGYSVDIGESAKKDFVPRAVRATIVADVENYFPVGGSLVVFVSPDSNFAALRTQFPAAAKTPLASIPEVLSVPPGSVTGTKAEAIANETLAVQRKAVFTLILPINMPEPQKRPDGTVDPARPGRATISVDLAAEIALFGYEKLYLLPRVQLLNAPGLVQLTPDDYLKLSVWMQVSGKTKR